MSALEDPIYSTHQNLFRSNAWNTWFHSFPQSKEWISTSGPYSLNILRPLEGFFSDYEDLSWAPAHTSTDWVVYRKLFPSECQTTSGGLFYSNALYLDLQKPLKPKSDKISHIRRTERKAERELGKVQLERINTPEGISLFLKNWGAFHTDAQHLSQNQLETWEHLLTSTPLPDWVRLYQLNAGSHVLACGLFFVFDRVFYFYSPATNPSSELRKYGGGKMLTHKLIEQAQEEGLDAFDFLQGDHEYKKHWNPESRPLMQVIIPRSLKGKLLFKLFQLKGRLKK